MDDDFDEMMCMAMEDEDAFGPGPGEDIPSQQKRPVGGEEGAANKRMKAVAPPPDPDDFDDDELLELAAQPAAGAALHPGPSSPAMGVGTTEDEEEMMNIASEKPHKPPATSSPFSPPISAETRAAARRALLPKRNPIDIEGTAFTVTGPSGERVFCGVEDPRPAARPSGIRSMSGQGPLLGKSIRDMMDAVEAKRRQRALDDSAHLAAALQQSALDAAQRASELGRGVQEGDGAEESLWVDKYSPKAFTELLSEEQTNREVLRWLKAWDHCVFGKPLPAAGKPKAAAAGGGGGGGPGLPSKKQFGSTGLQGAGKGFGGGKWELKPGQVRYGGWSERIVDVESDGRPRYKVLLMSGPPGLGKTTLAHVAARHCGYRTVEVNASDDRQAGALKQRIMDAVQMQPVMGDPRPNCVVIDEIDGAMGGSEGQGAINALIQVITAGSQKDRDGGADEGGPGGARKKKGGGGMRRLQRPIICICNDLYAPALRPLRDVALVYRFNPPTVSRVAARLRLICEREDLSVEGHALTALCDRTEGDVRSCLHTLQFLRRRGQPLRMADVQQLNVGRKDSTQSALRSWGDIFHSGQSKSRPRGADAEGARGEFRRVMQRLEDFGDSDLLLTGCLENHTNMRFHDTHLNKTADALEWMSVAQVMGHTHGQYAPAALMAVRRIAATPEKVKLEFPTAHGRYRRGLAASGSVVSAWMGRMSPRVRASLSASVAVREVAGPLLSVVTPAVRPVAPNLLTPRERHAVESTVGALVGYGLTFVTDTSEGAVAVGGDAMRLEPAVDALCEFSGRPPAGRPQRLPAAVQAMLAHEVQLEHIRRLEARRPEERNPEPSPGGAGGGGGSRAAPLTALERCARAEREMLEKGKCAVASTAGKRPASWLDAARGKNLGKKRTAAARKAGENGGRGGLTEAGGGGKVSGLPVLYKFNEGFTNAVKRPVVLKELL